MSCVVLTDKEFSDLVRPLGLQFNEDIKQKLSMRIEMATKNFIAVLTASDFDILNTEYREVLTKIADDPARALGYFGPYTKGGASAHSLLDFLAEEIGIDIQTRSGAVALGDCAINLLNEKKMTRRAVLHRDGEEYKIVVKTGSTRMDAPFIIAENTLFEDITHSIKLLSPAAISGLPSNDIANEVNDPAIEFARAFIESVLDRVIEYIPDLPNVAERKRNELLIKSNRGIVEKIRRYR